MIAGQDVLIIAPALAMTILAGVVIAADVLNQGKRRLLLIAIVGAIAPLGLALNLWVESLGAGFGGVVSGDRFAAFFQILIILAMMLVLTASFKYIDRLKGYAGEFVSLMLVACVGMLLLASARELITMYVAFELTAIPLAALAALRRGRRSIEAGIKFLMLSAIGSALMLFGIVLIYAYTGTTYFDQIGQFLGLMDTAAATAFAVLLGVVLIIAGLGFKMAVAPWQMWVPDVYEGAPTPVSALLSTASKASAFAALLALTHSAFGQTAVAQHWSFLVAVIAVVTMTFGNLGALRQRNLKRLLGYSTVAQAGYMLVGVASVASRTPSATSSLFADVGAGSVAFYLAAYAVTNLTVFLIVLGLANQAKSNDATILRGLGRRSPLVAIVFTVGILSLLGLPPTAGFYAKLTVFGAGANAGFAWAVVIGVVNSFVSAYYYLRIVRAMFMEDPVEGQPLASGKLDPGVIGASAAAVAGVLFISVVPFVVGDWANSAVESLMLLLP